MSKVKLRAWEFLDVDENDSCDESWYQGVELGQDVRNYRLWVSERMFRDTKVQTI